MRLAISAASAVGLLVSATPLHAQQSALGRLEGTIKEKIESRSVRAALVSLLRLDPETSHTISAKPDARGRFQVDSLPAGRYLIQISSPMLDSLELALPAVELSVPSGQTVRAEYTLPFGEKLRDAVCQGTQLGPGKAAVAGRAIDADTEQPIAGANVVASWTHITVDQKARQLLFQKRGVVVRAGPHGEYRMCGVPSGNKLSLQVQHQGRASAVVRLAVSDDEGAVVRDLSISPRTASTIAAFDSVEHLAAATPRDSTRAEQQLTGTSTLAGTVRRLTGEPVPGVHVRVHDARSSAVTDTAGKFVITSLPAGTQVLFVRHLGYPLMEIPVELRSGKTVDQIVLLVRPVALDSIRVVAQRSEYPEFESNRRTNSFGQFLTEKDIAERHAAETADLFANVLGFTAFGRGLSARVVSNSSLGRLPECRTANIVVEGAERLEINDVHPSLIAGIEAYSDASFVPARFAGRAACGVIVIWLKKHPFKPHKTQPPPGLRDNGYP
jgi:hypothetical protein